MTDNSKNGRHLIRTVCGVSLFIAVGLVAGELSSGWSANAHHEAEEKTDTKMKTDMKMEMATTGIFDGVGEIIALLPEKTQIVVGHEEIKGFMKAMPMGMGYDVESLDLLKGLKPGDRVRFKIDAGKKKIVSIEPLQ